MVQAQRGPTLAHAAWPGEQQRAAVVRPQEVRHLPRQVGRWLELVLEIAEALWVRLAWLVRFGWRGRRSRGFRPANPGSPGAQGLQVLVVVTVPIDEVEKLDAVFVLVVVPPTLSMPLEPAAPPK